LRADNKTFVFLSLLLLLLLFRRVLLFLSCPVLWFDLVWRTHRMVAR